MPLKAQTPAPESGPSRKCPSGIRRDCGLRSVCIGWTPLSWSSWSGRPVRPRPCPQPPELWGCLGLDDREDA